MSRSSIKDKFNIQNLGPELPSIQENGEITKNPVNGELLISKNNNWAPIYLDPSGDVSFGVYYIVNNLSQHTSPQLYDLVYETSTHTLWRYHGQVGSNRLWLPIDWKSRASRSNEFAQSRLRYINDYLEISPNGTDWHIVYPLVGARTIQIHPSAIDNTNYSRIFWLPVGITANITSANHLPIAFAKTVRPAYNITSMSNTSYDLWIGFRPNNVTVSNGDGQYMASGNTSVNGYRHSNLNIFPIIEQDSAVSGSENRFQGFITFSTTNENRILGNSYGLGHQTFVIVINNTSATIPSTTYWFGTWYRQDNVQFTPFFTSITRIY